MDLNSGDTAWILMSTALVLFMTPGLAFFYGGLVRGRNAISTISTQLRVDGRRQPGLGPLGLQPGIWRRRQLKWVHRESLLRRPEWNRHRRRDWRYTRPPVRRIPDDVRHHHTGADHGRGRRTIQVHAVHHLPRALADIRLRPHLPLGLGRWLDRSTRRWGRSAGLRRWHGRSHQRGIAALVAAVLVGRRRRPAIEPHNVPYVVLGAGILWFGWFGFNAGSGLVADGQAVNALLVTNTAAAAGALTWGILSYIQNKRMSAVGIATGAVAGLVAITPAAGFVSVTGALVLGIGAGILPYIFVLYRRGWGSTTRLRSLACMASLESGARWELASSPSKPSAEPPACLRATQSRWPGK